MRDRRVAAQAGSLFRSFRTAAETHGVSGPNQAAAVLLAATLCHRAGIYATREDWIAFVLSCCPRISPEQRHAIWSAAGVAPVRFDYAQQARVLDDIDPDCLRRAAGRARKPSETAELIGFLRVHPDLAMVADYATFLDRWRQSHPDAPPPSRQRVATARKSLQRLGATAEQVLGQTGELTATTQPPT